MSAKNMDQQGRWRNKTVVFRVSPEEDELIETAVSLSGLTKQGYICLLYTSSAVTMRVCGTFYFYNGSVKKQ